MPSLGVLAGPVVGRRFKLGDGDHVIGRRSDCQIFAPDMRASRQDARLWRDGGGWSLEELGSNNGTFLDGVRLDHPTSVRHDDEISIASNQIRVEARASSATAAWRARSGAACSPRAYPSSGASSSRSTTRPPT